MDIQISVYHQTLSVKPHRPIVSDSQEFIRFVFDFTDDWEKLLPFAQFAQGEETYNIYLDEDNSVYLPPEITEGTFTLTLCGTGGETVATTNYKTFRFIKGNLVSDEKSTDITLTLYEQLVNRIEWDDAIGIDRVETTESTEDGGVNTVKFIFTDGESKSFEVRNGNKGTDGKTPVKGTDYFTDEDVSEIVSKVLAEVTDATEVAY